MVIDHIIPHAFGGADDLANLVTMQRAANSAKWDALYGRIYWYRGERVKRRIGMRWRNGAFWPVVNGTVRTARFKTP